MPNLTGAEPLMHYEPDRKRRALPHIRRHSRVARIAFFRQSCAFQIQKYRPKTGSLKRAAATPAEFGSGRISGIASRTQNLDWPGRVPGNRASSQRGSAAPTELRPRRLFHAAAGTANPGGSQAGLVQTGPVQTGLIQAGLVQAGRALRSDPWRHGAI